MREYDAKDLTGLKPIRSAPTLGTVNGIGFLLMGFRPIRNTDLFVTTRFFTFFFVPLLPIARYVVERVGTDSFRFYYTVPLTRGQAWVRFAVPALLLAWILGPFGDGSQVDAPVNEIPQYPSVPAAQGPAPSPQQTPDLKAALAAIQASLDKDVGPRPKTGHRIGRWRGANGPCTFTLVNDTDQDVAAALVPVGKKRAYRYFYVRAGESHTLRKVKTGTYQILYQTGSDWSDKRRRFLTDLEAYRSDQVAKLRAWTEGPDEDGMIW
jgi:hypothetical protein